MKRWLCLVLAGMLLLCCTACNGEPASSVDAGTDVSATTATTAKRTDGTTMTDDDAIKLCAGLAETARTIQFWFLMGETGSESLPTGTSVKTLDDQEYILDTEYYIFTADWSGIDNWSAKDLKAVIESVYTYEVAYEHFYSNPYRQFVEYQEKLYRIGADGLTGNGLDTSQIRIIKKGKEAITFCAPVAYCDTTVEHTVKLTDNGWRFDENIYDAVYVADEE